MTRFHCTSPILKWYMTVYDSLLFDVHILDIFRQIDEHRSLTALPLHRPRLSSDMSHVSQSRSVKNRFLRITAAIILCYVLCWLPYQIFSLWSSICLLRPDLTEFCAAATSGKLEWLVDILVANSCINPLLYRFKTDDLRSSDRNRSPKNFQTARPKRRLARKNRLSVDTKDLTHGETKFLTVETALAANGLTGNFSTFSRIVKLSEGNDKRYENGYDSL